MRNKKRPEDMTAAELAERNMHLAGSGPRLPARGPLKRPRHSEWAKTNEQNLETLARARVRTQFGAEGVRRCQSVSRSTGKPCGNPAIRGEKVCWAHARGVVIARLQERRLKEGRPLDTATRVALRNVRALVRHNKLDRDLLLQPVFQSLMRVIAPSWFGQPRTALGKKITRRDVGDAGLLAREMVLAWETAKNQGDLMPWTSCVSRARQLGYDGVNTPFT